MRLYELEGKMLRLYRFDGKDWMYYDTLWSKHFFCDRYFDDTGVNAICVLENVFSTENVVIKQDEMLEFCKHFIEKVEEK